MDYYKILGVSKDATKKEIDTAWKSKRIKAHPDKGGSEEDFQKLQTAYDTIGDTNKRYQYDNPQQGGFSHTFTNVHTNFHDMSAEMQEAIQRAGFRRPHKSNPNNISRVAVSLKDAYNGTTIDISPPWETSSLQITLPPGTRPQSNFRLQGMGEEVYKDLPRGNLDIMIDIPAEEEWDISGNDLVRILRVTAIESMLGVKKKFKHLNGKKYKIAVPKGTGNGDKHRMPGLGMPIDNMYGNLWVIFLITIPAINNEKHLKMLRTIQKDLEKEYT